MAADTPPRPLVFVSVGTDHHRFDRLLEMIDHWRAHRPQVDVLVQRGHTPERPGLDAVDFMGPDELGAVLDRATAVVCHGGPSTIMEARERGHRPVVVARDPATDEHVDGHQLRFVERIAADGIVVAVQTQEAFEEAVDAAIAAGPPREPCPDRPEALAAIGRIGELLDGLIAVDAHPTDAHSRTKEPT